MQTEKKDEEEKKKKHRREASKKYYRSVSAGFVQRILINTADECLMQSSCVIILLNVYTVIWHILHTNV